VWDKQREEEEVNHASLYEAKATARYQKILNQFLLVMVKIFVWL
jgi:hypothetical protein